MLHPRTLKMCAGPKPARTGEQSIGTLCSRKQTSETSVMRCYLNVKVRVLQVHGRKPVPGANLRQDLFQRYHPEWTFAKRSVDGSEI